MTWQLPSGTRSEAIDAEVARLLYRSGCRNLSYAPESGSPEVLEQIKKRVKIPRMLESMRDCTREGLSLKVNIIAGLPDEEPRHVMGDHAVHRTGGPDRLRRPVDQPVLSLPRQ